MVGVGVYPVSCDEPPVDPFQGGTRSFLAPGIETTGKVQLNQLHFRRKRRIMVLSIYRVYCARHFFLVYTKINKISMQIILVYMKFIQIYAACSLNH